MSETTVIHVRDMQPGDVYIGRLLNARGSMAGIAGSPFANPFRITRAQSREDVIASFEDWVKRSPETKAAWIREHVHELEGKRLACWCHPLPCHGDVLVKILKEREAR